MAYPTATTPPELLGSPKARAAAVGARRRARSGAKAFQRSQCRRDSRRKYGIESSIPTRRKARTDSRARSSSGRSRRSFRSVSISSRVRSTSRRCSESLPRTKQRPNIARRHRDSVRCRANRKGPLNSKRRGYGGVPQRQPPGRATPVCCALSRCTHRRVFVCVSVATPHDCAKKRSNRAISR